MIPQVDRHPLVQHSPNFDPAMRALASADCEYGYSTRLDQRFHHSSTGTGFTHPFRRQQNAVQATPNQRRLATSAVTIPRFSDLPEHQLRRKTPNGTIDAGYDGSPAQMAPGPPPLKHMIVPVTSTIPRHSPASTTAFATLSSYGQDATFKSLPTVPGPSGAWSMAGAVHPKDIVVNNNVTTRYLIPESHQYHPCHLQEMPGLFRTAYQPYIKHGTIHAAAFGSPPVVELRDGVRGHLADRHLARPLYPLQGADVTNPYGINQPFPAPTVQGCAQVQTPMGYIGAPLLYGHPDQMGTANFASSSGVQPVNLNLETLTLGPGARGGSSASSGSSVSKAETASPSRFREKVLTQAHQAYVELLTHHHHARKVLAGRNAYGAGASASTSKLAVYPKPPRPFGTGSTTSSTDLRGGLATESPTIGAHSASSRMGSGLMNENAMGSHDSAGTAGVVQRLQSIRGASSLSHTYSPTMYSSLGQDKKSPIVAAQTSLEMLCHLCEQSGWKWVDGMLLGGCLHYGLEHYEKALEWFSRIIELDSSHVEAISNKAATLYCLNRQEEAEKHWLKAIKSRPQYLEAVEHLVGLLYKKRSKEAVDVISFVQQTLRIPDAPSPRVRSGTNISGGTGTGSGSGSAGNMNAKSSDGQRGYGSSGYAIPGSDNGRILALVHAKGTMLYGLKDVHGASQAFEEAVLISTDRQIRCVQNLVRKIQSVLSPCAAAGTAGTVGDGPDAVRAVVSPLLLPPERARYTAQLVFSGAGELPGLRYVPEGGPKKAAIQTTSNSLLSLAKIFQDAMSNGTPSSGLTKQPSGVGDILALYYLSLSLQESPSTANNVGILLASVQQPSAPQQQPPQGQERLTHTHPYPSIPGIAPGSGLSLALAYYHYGLSLEPKHVHLHTNLGSLLKDIGQLDLAIQMYEQAVACDGTFDIALTNLANAVKDRGRISDAIMYYKRAVNSNPEFAEAVCGLSTALNSVCDWRGRGGVLLGGGKYDRWHVDDSGMLQDIHDHGHEGGLMKRVVDIVRRQLDESSNWGLGILQDEGMMAMVASHVGALSEDVHGFADQVESELKKWARGRWEGARLLRLIERATRSMTWRWYRDRHVLGKESRSGYPRIRLPTSLAVPSAPTVLPFHTFTCPLTARDIRMISQRNALRISCSTLRSPWLPASVYPPPKPPSPQLNIGYLSSDFNNHPLAHLMQSVFGFHDPLRAKAFCYATTASDRSVHRQQIEREAPVFRDVSNWSSDTLVDQIVKDGIHILVNLNGYTRGARNEIFAARPAPIQMSFMGFAGTLGAEWCDYILADPTAIPRETLRPWRSNRGPADVFQDGNEDEDGDWVYSENVIFCRDTFFCCDHAQSAHADERSVTWHDEQRRRWKMRKELFPSLPDDAIILGNFNQLYKVDPTTFRTWLRILARVPKAILWLLRFPELGESNLRRTATAWAGAQVARRIIFTDVAPKNQHITRARVCDLFLDTPECNAHTTAADVLWSSTPLLTFPRYPYKMCSRMAASILKGALPRSDEGAAVAAQLTASSDEEYEKTAIELAGGLTYRMTVDGYGLGLGRLADMRRLLHESKWRCALFDTRRWVRDLESAYEEAWRRWVSGEAGDIYL